MRRGGRPCPPLKSYEFSEDFHKNGIFCGRTEASAPTVLWRIFRKVRRGRCPHRPGKMRRFYRNLRRIRNFSWGDVGIAPYARLRHAMCSRAPYAWLERRKNADSQILPASWLFCFQPVRQALGVEKAQGLGLREMSRKSVWSASPSIFTTEGVSHRMVSFVQRSWRMSAG